MAMVFMERPALLRNSFWLCCFWLAACQYRQVVDIPNLYVLGSDPSLKQNSGYLFYKTERFSGRLYELYPNGDTALLFPYHNGKEEGWCRKWYADGKKMEERFYREGWKEGEHKAWWPDGRSKFLYHFLNDEHEGEAREWFTNGNLARLFHYAKGQEAGLQQMWWEDGKVRANYVVKDGEQYGLIGRKLCKNSPDEKK
jgi:antitoxin component YwqK of YwqJK toxin-antitoxin module